MPSPKYRVELLDSALVPITRVQNLVPLDTSGNFLEYQSKLSQYGFCKFRIGTKDPMWNQFGDIAQPYANHVRVYRSNVLVWSGVIVQCTKRNKNFIEIRAFDYLYLLSKVLLRHDATGDVNYRTVNSGTLATAVQTILTEAKADGPSTLNLLTLGNLENPNFPANFTDINGLAIGGQPWTFSSNFLIKFDYRDVLYVLQSFGTYANCDFTIDQNMNFTFQKFIGNKQPNIMFEYSNYGAIEDYELPLDGDRMANYLVGIAADIDGNILKVELTDDDSIKKYGKVPGVAAYTDVKNIDLLRSRITQELQLVSTPDSEINIVLNDRAYPLGQYGLGDIVTIKIKDHIINVNVQRRVVAIDVKVHKTGKETIRLVTNVPQDTQ